jgi:hypothetical protein
MPLTPPVAPEGLIAEVYAQFRLRIVTNQTPYAGPPWHGPPKTSAWSRMKVGQRAGLIIAALLLPCCGGVVTVGVLASNSNDTDTSSGTTATGERLSDLDTTTATTAPTAEAESVTPTSTASATAAPVVERRTVTETKKIGYSTRTENDSSLAKGSRKVRTKGVAGVKTLTYEVTMTGGRQTSKKLLRTTVTRRPVTKVVAVGTKPKAANHCDPNYGGCVPIASDVDCSGGSGNGPAYVSGPVKVIGSDIYDLDNDNDGYGCDD